MASARYWRLVGLATAADTMGLSAAILVDVSGNRLDTSATMSCSHAPAEGALGNLIDGNSATVTRWSGGVHRAGGFYIQWDLGSAQNAYAVRMGGDIAANWPGRLTLVYLDTSTGRWTNLVSADWLVYPGDGVLTNAVEADPFFSIYSGAVGAPVVDYRGHTLTTTGSVGFSTAQQLDGQNSIYFPGASGNDLMVTGGDLGLGAGPLTFDVWFYIAANAAADVDGVRGVALFSTFTNSGTGFNVTVLGSTTTTGTGLALDTWTVSGSGKLFRATASISQGAWHHYEGSVDGSGVRRLFLDGTQITGSYINVGGAGASFTSPSSAMWLGKTNNDNYPLRLNGYLLNPRITLGVRHTSNFTPATKLSAPTMVRRGSAAQRGVLGASSPTGDIHVVAMGDLVGFGADTVVGPATSAVKTWDGSQWNSAGRVVVWTAP